MNAHDDVDPLIARWLVANARDLAPASVHAQAMARVGRARQRARWSAMVRTRLAAPGSKATVRYLSIVGVASLLVVGSTALALMPAGTPQEPAPSVTPSSSVMPEATRFEPMSRLPAAIPDILPVDIERALVDKRFTCTPHYREADERSRFVCNKGANYTAVFRGRNPTSVYYIDATVTGVSESYAASFAATLREVCAPYAAGPEEWIFSNIHTGGETTIGQMRIRITVVNEGTWRIEIRAA